MNFHSRAATSFALPLSLLLGSMQPALADARPEPAAETAAKASADAVPWLYRGSDVPPDRSWTFGELANGLRYAVRKNGVPPGQVSVRIRVDAGSLNERDPEQGFAHLLEHLLFRQSKYLAEGAAIPTWQRLGAAFGSDTNAETSTTQTVYKLDLPNATAASLDESFKLLSGMVSAPALSESNLKLDVPIVLAEMRERGGAPKRVQEAMRRTFYAGQPIAQRSPIGTPETLRAATPASVRAFYERWYRPENVVIVVAGDAEPAQLEALVRKWFSGWKAPGQPLATPSFGDPVAPAGADAANPVGQSDVIVEPDLPRGITYAVLRPWRQVNDTIVYNQGLMTDALAQAIINRRLESRARAGGSYLVAQVNQDDVSRSADATFVSITPLGKDWKAALADVRGVIADAIAAPPSREEIDREIAELEVAFQVPVEQRALLPGSKLADDLVTALDIRETVAAPDDVLRIFRESKPLFTPAAILQHTRQLFTGTVVRGVYVTPDKTEADGTALRQALLTPAKADASVRLASKPIDFTGLPMIGKPGKVLTETSTGLLGIEQVEFANGVKALLWPVAEEPGRVMVKVRFGGGYRSFEAKDAPYIGLGQMALVGSGAATLGQEELDRVATGRKLGFDFEIKDAAFELSAETRPADLADQLYLFAAKLDLPLWEENPFRRAKAAAELQYEAFSTSPQGVLERDLEFYQRGQDPRFKTPSPAEIETASPAEFRKVWSRALKSGPVEVQIFGDYDKAAALESLQKTFGALAPRKNLAEAGMSQIAPPAPSSRPFTLIHRGDPDQAAAVVSWPTGGGSLGISESRQIELLTQLFSNRLLEAMREKSGTSYAPYVYSTWPVDLRAGGSITAIGQLDPEAVPVFFQTAEEIAADLVAHPVSADELARVVEPMRQQVNRAASSSSFFMQQLEGATNDPVRINAVRSIMVDYTQTTPERMQALAARYLGVGRSWKLAVVPAAPALVPVAAAGDPKRLP
ncbi:MAG TPA: insulinase family protein [Novosphingobium sp.]|nr:insulinase family protein [Novosphingobium sp.]